MTKPYSVGKDRAFVQPGASGTVLTSNGPTANPSYKAVPDAPPPGALGTVLTSNGVSVDPTYQSIPNAPAPGAAGTILTSNGTSVAPTYQSPQLNPTKIVIASADLLLLPGANPIILASPGAGKVLVVESIMWRYIFGTIPYTPGNADNNLQVSYESDPAIFLIGGASINCTGFVDQSVNMLAWMAEQFYQRGDTTLQAYPETDAADQPLVLTITGTTPALILGDGSLEIEVLTHVFTL